MFLRYVSLTNHVRLVVGHDTCLIEAEGGSCQTWLGGRDFRFPRVVLVLRRNRRYTLDSSTRHTWSSIDGVSRVNSSIDLALSLATESQPFV